MPFKPHPTDPTKVIYKTSEYWMPKPWQGLTEEDCIEAQKNSWNEYKNGKELKFDGYKLCKNIEQILKEKNNG